MLSVWQTQLLSDLSRPDMRVHFCEPEDLANIEPELIAKDTALFKLDGVAITTQEQMFEAFAKALMKPKGWYGDEEYATNANAFLEYLDDVHEWVPAKGHIVIIQRAEQFWKSSPRLAGMLVELWQCATGRGRNSDIHLLFVW